MHDADCHFPRRPCVCSVAFPSLRAGNEDAREAAAYRRFWRALLGKHGDTPPKPER